ncbi:unnamed protein product [Prunus armeniaca]
MNPVPNLIKALGSFLPKTQLQIHLSSNTKATMKGPTSKIPDLTSRPKPTSLSKVPSHQQSLRLTQLLSYLPSVNATSSLTTWGTRDCPTAPTEPGMLGHDHTKAYKFPTQKSLLDRELGGLLFTP